MNIYVTKKISPKKYQISYLDVLQNRQLNFDTRNYHFTKTEIVDNSLLKGAKYTRIRNQLLLCLKEFNFIYENLIAVQDKQELYHSFDIAKGSKVPEKALAKKKYKKKFRHIDAPNEELKRALRNLKGIFEFRFKVNYHSSAYAYVKHRKTLDLVTRHQKNESMWFLKLDFSDFFGSISQEFLESQLSMIYPFSLLMEDEEAKTELHKTLSLCFLNNKLPQGTPISPMLTNILMIPIDYKISSELRNKFGKVVYTRYADDMCISHQNEFNYKKVISLIEEVLREFNAPLKLNEDKTHYGNRNGKNFILGIQLNKDNNMTIGHVRKKELKTALFCFLRDHFNGERWSLHEVQILNGKIAYGLDIEKEAVNEIVQNYSKKFNCNVIELIKKYLKEEI